MHSLQTTKGLGEKKDHSIRVLGFQFRMQGKDAISLHCTRDKKMQIKGNSSMDSSGRSEEEIKKGKLRNSMGTKFRRKRRVSRKVVRNSN